MYIIRADQSLLAGKWPDSRSACMQGVLKVKVKVKGHVIRALLYWHENRFLSIIGIRGIIHYSSQVCNLLFLAFQYSSPGGSTTAGEVCYLRLHCLFSADYHPRSEYGIVYSIACLCVCLSVCLST